MSVCQMSHISPNAALMHRQHGRQHKGVPHREWTTASSNDYDSSLVDSSRPSVKFDKAMANAGKLAVVEVTWIVNV